MRRSVQQILCYFSVVVGVGICTATSVGAQPPNQSDTSGTNVFNNTAPRFRTPAGLDPELVNRASQISQELTDAQNAYNAAEQAAAQTVRRYAVRPTEPCVNPVLDRLNRAVEQARTFLAGLDQNQLDQLKATGLKIW